MRRAPIRARQGSRSAPRGWLRATCTLPPSHLSSSVAPESAPPPSSRRMQARVPSPSHATLRTSAGQSSRSAVAARSCGVRESGGPGGAAVAGCPTGTWGGSGPSSSRRPRCSSSGRRERSFANAPPGRPGAVDPLPAAGTGALRTRRARPTMACIMAPHRTRDARRCVVRASGRVRARGVDPHPTYASLPIPRAAWGDRRRLVR
jgi:hypothetical protein